MLGKMKNLLESFYKYVEFMPFASRVEGGVVPVYENPSRYELDQVKDEDEYKTLRIGIENGGKMYAWPAFGGTHDFVARQLGIRDFVVKDEIEKRSPSHHVYIDIMDLKKASVFYEKVKNKIRDYLAVCDIKKAQVFTSDWENIDEFDVK